MKRLPSWLRERGYLLGQARAFLGTLVTIAIALAMGFAPWSCPASHGGTGYPWPCEPALRVTGWLLQILGVLTVAWGIRQTRQQFGLPGIFKGARQWVSAFLTWRRHVVTVSAHGVISTSGFGRGRVRTGVGPNPSLEERIAALEKNQKLMEEEFDHERVETEKKFREQAEALSEERRAREQDHRTVSERFTEAHTGGLRLSATGVVFILLGTTMSTVPIEIIRLMNLAPPW